MKRLIEGYATIEDYGRENLKITLHNNQNFMTYLGVGGKDMTDIVIEELSNGGIKITGKSLIYTAGYTKSRKYIKNMLSRPYSEYLKKDIFGREYIPAHHPYLCPPRISEKEVTYISNHYTIIKEN